jgi:serine/threonine protein kinase
VLGQLTPNEQKQALLEADLLRNLNHINITSYKGSFIDKDVLIIIMEFCESKYSLL